MIAADLAQSLDPALFMRVRGGMIPDPWQEAFVRSPAQRHLLLCARQVGKSTVTACLATHTALYEPGALVLILAPSQQQSFELFRKVTQFYRLAAPVDPDLESARRVELPNGSRIVSLSGNALTAHGFSAPRLILIDEACFADDELYSAITPMLAGGGRLILLSSPNGKAGFFYEAWEHGGEAWARTRVTADDSPRISPEFLALERLGRPDRDFRREYLCEFVDMDEQLFSTDLLDRAFTATAASAPFLADPFAWERGGRANAA